MFNKLKIVILIVAFYLTLSQLAASVKREVLKTFKPLLATKKNRLWAAEHEGIGIYKNVIFVFFKIPKWGLRDRTGKSIVMPPLPSPTAFVEAYLVIPRNHGKAVPLMNDIIKKCTNNIHVSILLADLDEASGFVEDYNKAHGDARKTTLDIAVAALEVFMAKFQAFSQKPENKKNSIVILQSGGFHVKGIGGNHASVWDAFAGDKAGEVMLTAITGEGTCCYDYWMSLDNITWIRMEPSPYNHTTFSGLAPNTDIWVRYQLIENGRA